MNIPVILFIIGVLAVGYWLGYAHGEKSSSSYKQGWRNGFKKGVAQTVDKTIAILDYTYQKYKEKENEKN